MKHEPLWGAQKDGMRVNSLWRHKSKARQLIRCSTEYRRLLCPLATLRSRSIQDATQEASVWLQHAPLYSIARTQCSEGTALPAKARAEVDSIAVDEGRIMETELRHEAERSYMSYAMSVIVGRALPDVRDGLKPVQRRILYAMEQLGLEPNKPFRKCARVVGEVLGKYHPHGDASVYDALVRMAQDFSMRAPLVSGHGNFGSIDDDPAAAMRYTECRLQGLAADALLADLDADTVDFSPNFDASQEEPGVLPAKVPMLLVNGAGGIAVGIATKIPPHNMRELVAALKALVESPAITDRQLMTHVPAPDFPTGGEILVTEGLRDAYLSGRGSITVRAKTHIEAAGEGNGKRKAAAAAAAKSSQKQLVVITELPFQVYKADVVEHIAKLVEGGIITGVSDIRDESDRSGIRVVVEVKRGSNAQLVQNALFKHTSLQTRFSCNMVALVNSKPETMTLKDFLKHFLEFRCSVIVRRTQHQLRRTEVRLHQVEGFLMAMQQLDAVIEAIRKANSSTEAAAALQQRFGLSEEQSKGVLALTLSRLTRLESDKLREESNTLQARARDLQGLLDSKQHLLEVVVQEAEMVAAKHGNPRRSRLVDGDTGEITATDVIPNDPCVITFSRKGYIKRMPADTFALAKRGTQGRIGTKFRGDDVVDSMISCLTHDPLLVFTQDGVVRTLPAYKIPESSRTSVGTAVAQVLSTTKTHMIAGVMVMPAAPAEDEALLLLTEQGMLKKTPLAQFSNIRSNGVSALRLKGGDQLVDIAPCCSQSEVVLTSSCGMVIRHPVTEEYIRTMSRLAAGVQCMKLKPFSRIVGMAVITAEVRDGQTTMSTTVEEDDTEDDEEIATADPNGGAEPDMLDEPCLLLVTSKGLGKRVRISAVRIQRRNGIGAKAIVLQPGDAVAAVQLVEAGTIHDVILSTKLGMFVRIRQSSFPMPKSRLTKGFRVIKLKDGDEVQAMTLAPPDTADRP